MCCRESFVFGRQYTFSVLENSVRSLDVGTVLLILLYGVFDHSSPENISQWNNLVNLLPQSFSNSEFETIIRNHGNVNGSDASVLFDGGESERLTELLSLSRKISLIREILVSYRDNNYHPESSESADRVAFRPVFCDGGFFCRIEHSGPRKTLFDPDIYPSMEAYEYELNHHVCYSLDSIGGSAFGGLVLLVRKTENSYSDQIGDDHYSKTIEQNAFALRNVSKVLTVDGEWMNVKASDSEYGIFGRKRGNWSTILDSGETFSRPLQYISVQDRFLCMPSAVLDPKFVCLQNNAEWIQNILRSNSPECNSALNHAVKTVHGSCENVGLANVLFRRFGADSNNEVERKFLLEFKNLCASYSYSVPHGSYGTEWMDRTFISGISIAAEAGNVEVCNFLLAFSSSIYDRVEFIGI